MWSNTSKVKALQNTQNSKWYLNIIQMILIKKKLIKPILTLLIIVFAMNELSIWIFLLRYLYK